MTTFFEPLIKRHKTFVTESTKSGHGSYATKHAFSVVPLNIGFILDTLMGTHGWVGEKNVDNKYSGLFGFLISFLPKFIGTLTGVIVYLCFNLLNIIGHEIDYALGWGDVAGWSDKSRDKLPGTFTHKGKPNQAAAILMGAHQFLTKHCYQFHVNMDGVFGFVFGVIPQLIEFAYVNLIAFVVSSIELLTDTLCAGITAGMNFVKYTCLGMEQPVAPAHPPSDGYHHVNPQL